MVNSARIFPMGLVVAATTLAFAAGPGSAFADVPAPGPSVASSTRSLEQQDSPDTVVDEAPDYEAPDYQEPDYQEPDYQEPDYQEPDYQEPDYQEP
ncbi:MAG TPA: hypothetical protein VGJ32_02420, partial [Solirubrobacteraceae bacterium]